MSLATRSRSAKLPASLKIYSHTPRPNFARFWAGIRYGTRVQDQTRPIILTPQPLTPTATATNPETLKPFKPHKRLSGRAGVRPSLGHFLVSPLPLGYVMALLRRRDAGRNCIVGGRSRHRAAKLPLPSSCCPHLPRRRRFHFQLAKGKTIDGNKPSILPPTVTNPESSSRDSVPETADPIYVHPVAHSNK